MISNDEKKQIFTALDKKMGDDDSIFMQIILDKCGDKVYINDDNSISFDDEIKEKLRFKNNTSSISYSESYGTCILYDCKLDTDEKEPLDKQNLGLGGCNFIFFTSYNANPNNFSKVINEIMEYYGINSADELTKILKDSNISQETITKLFDELKLNFSESDLPSTDMINQMCDEFLSADDSEIKTLFEKLQTCIDPKFIVANLYENELINENEYYRLRTILRNNEAFAIDKLEIYLEPHAMLSLGAIDNTFKLVNDDKKGFVLKEMFEIVDDTKSVEFSYLDLLDKFPQKNIYKTKLAEYLANTQNSPYEIRLKTNTKGSSSNTVRQEQETADDEISQDTRLNERDIELFENALTYVRFKADPHYFSYMQKLRESKEFYKQIPINDTTKSYIRAKMAQINKYSSSMFDERRYAYESAMQKQKRQEQPFQALKYSNKARQDYIYSQKFLGKTRQNAKKLLDKIDKGNKVKDEFKQIATKTLDSVFNDIKTYFHNKKSLEQDFYGINNKS